MTYNEEMLKILPNGWIKAKLSDISEIILGQSPPSTTYNEKGEGLPFYQGKLEFGKIYPTPRKWCTKPKKIAEKNDILISVRAPVGPTNIAPEKTCIGRGLAAIRGLGGIESRFLLYYLRSIEDKISGQGTGTTFKAITGIQIKNIPALLPPLPEQHRIVAKIEELFSDLDNGIENLKKAQAQLKIYRQAVLKYAFEGKLTAAWRQQNASKLESAEQLLKRIKAERESNYNQQLAQWRQAVKEWEKDGKKGKKPAKPKPPKEFSPLTTEELAELPVLPEEWVLVKLGQISNIIGGVTKGRKLEGKETIELPYLRVANVQDGYLDLDEIKTIEVLPSDLEKYRLIEGDILFTEGGDKDKLGRGTIWRSEIKNCIHQNHIFRARFDDNTILQPYIAYAAQTSTAKDYFFSMARQTVNLASINLTVLSNWPLPVAPEREQHQIVSEIESRLSVCDKLEETIEEGLKKAELLRQSILKKAFEGKLVPQDPNDEPAEKLLERIKTEKTKHP